MKKIALLFALLFSSQGFASSATIIKGDVFHGFSNALLNPTFDRPTFNESWTVTTVTSAKETTTIAPGAGKQSAKLTYSAQTGGISQSRVPGWNTDSVNFEASCKVLTTMTTIEVCGLTNGTNANCQAVPASGTWQTVTTNFPGPANGTSVGVKVDTTASGTGTVYVDDCYVGPARNLGSGTFTTPWVSYTPTFTGFGTVSTQAFWYRRIGDTLYIKGNFTTGTVTATEARISFPPGLTTDPNKVGALEIAGVLGRAASGSTYFGAYVTREAASNYLTFSIQSSAINNLTKQNGTSFSAGEQMSINEAAIPVKEFTDQSFLRTDSASVNWSGYHNGISAGCSVTSSTFGDTSACTGITLTPVTSRNITCTTASGSLPGIACTLPSNGNYRVCAYPGLLTSNGNNMAVRLVDGSGTVLNPGIPFVPANATASATPAVCGGYSAPAPGLTTFKLQAAINLNTGYVGYLSGQSMPVGTQQIYWTVEQSDNPKGSTFSTGSVTSNSNTQGFRVEYVKVASVCSASPCTITSQSGNWLSATSSIVRNSAGNYTVNFASGEFTSAPACTLQAGNGANTMWQNGGTLPAQNTTSWTFTTNNAANSPTDTAFDIICMGPH